jgi:hypothetical protein
LPGISLLFSGRERGCIFGTEETPAKTV